MPHRRFRPAHPSGASPFPDARERERSGAGPDQASPHHDGQSSASPGVYRVESELPRRLSIPVLHDDRHGTAIVVLAAVLSAARRVKEAAGKA